MRFFLLTAVVALASAESAGLASSRAFMGYFVGIGFLALALSIFYRNVRSFKWTKKTYATLRSQGTVAQVQVSNKLQYTTKGSFIKGYFTTTHYYTCDLEWQAVDRNGEAYIARKKQYHCPSDVWTILPEQSEIVYWKDNLHMFALQDELNRKPDVSFRDCVIVFMLFSCPA